MAMASKQEFWALTRMAMNMSSDLLATIRGAENGGSQSTFGSCCNPGTHFHFGSFYLTFFDALYLFELVEGTLEAPIRFVIVPSFKAFFSCFRFNFGQTLTSSTL